MRTSSKNSGRVALVLAAATIGLASCGGGGGESTEKATASAALAGTVSGLAAGQQITLLNNAGDALQVSGSGDGTTPIGFSFASVATGDSYSIAVGAHTVGVSCYISGATGTAQPATSISVTCGAGQISSLYAFDGVATHGSGPIGALVIDVDGTLFGVSGGGINNDHGEVFALRKTGNSYTYETIYDFTGEGTDMFPMGGLTMDSDGNLFGVLSTGGGDVGRVYELQKNGNAYSYQSLYSFTNGADGGLPKGQLAIDGAGNLFGVTSYGGSASGYSGNGVVFMLQNNSGTYSYRALYTFQGGADGSMPTGVTLDSAGNLLGFAECNGGTPFCSGNGVVFLLKNNSGAYSYSVVYSFSGGTAGANPTAAPTLDAAGNIFGTAAGGNSNSGVVFSLNNSGGAYSYQTLYTFSGGADGAYPVGGVMLDSSGNLYGATDQGGASNYGVVYALQKVAGAYSYRNLQTFSGGSDGAYPGTGLAIDSLGNLLGGTRNHDLTGGGTLGNGVVFRID